MKNIAEIIESASELQELAEKRGWELLMAKGSRVLYRSCDKIDFNYQEGCIYLQFTEKTNHDCPETESIILTIDELTKSEKEWGTYLHEVKQEAADKYLQKKQDEQARILAEKRRQLEELKRELGEA